MNQDYSDNPAQLAALEAKWATGFTEVDGRHVWDAGLVARDGRRRVFAGEAEDDMWQEIRADTLERVAKEALHGRTATIFEGRVINPLFGRPRRSIADLAHQFGVQASRIYKILDKAKVKVMELIIKKAAAKKSPLGEACPTCGRIYEVGNLSTCKRGYGRDATHNLSPTINQECIPMRYRYRGGGKRSIPATRLEGSHKRPH